MHTQPGKAQPALIGGVFIGLTSGLTFLDCLNYCFCCALILGGGFLASWLYVKKVPPGPEPPYGDGALVGLLAGAVGAVLATGLSLLFNAAGMGMSVDDLEQMEEALGQSGVEYPPEFMDFMARFVEGDPAMMAITMAFTLGFNLLRMTIFGMLGGVLGVALLFEKTLPPAPPQPVAPGPPPATL